MPRGSKPGERRGGRVAGTPNKLTRDLKEMIEGALSDLGGRAWLVKAANEKPAAFMQLLGKLLPKDIVIDERPRTLEEMTNEELMQIVAMGREKHG